jgi:hypothetical protein
MSATGASRSSTPSSSSLASTPAVTIFDDDATNEIRSGANTPT